MGPRAEEVEVLAEAAFFFWLDLLHMLSATSASVAV